MSIGAKLGVVRLFKGPSKGIGCTFMFTHFHKCTTLVVESERGRFNIRGGFAKRNRSVFEAVFAKGRCPVDKISAGVRLAVSLECRPNGKQPHGDHGNVLSPEGPARNNGFKRQEQCREEKPRHQMMFVVDIAHGGNARLFQVIFELDQGGQLHKARRCPSVRSGTGLSSLYQGGFVESRHHGLSIGVCAESRGTSTRIEGRDGCAIEGGHTDEMHTSAIL